MPLTDTAIRKAKPGPKPRKLFDAGGLFLLLNPNGSRWWRFRYRLGGREKLLSLGTYPDVPLKDAREKRDEFRKLVAKGVDPSQVRKSQRTQGGEGTFKAIATEWHEKQRAVLKPTTAKEVLRRLERDIFDHLGHRPIQDITAQELLAVLRRIESRGAIETVHRVRGICGRIFAYAVASGKAERNPATDLKGALQPVKVKHHASITDPKQIGGLLRAIDAYAGHFATKCALRLAPLVFVRPGELRKAEWSEFDFESAEWRIPPEKMKLPTPHIVPLSRQAVEILREIHALTGPSGFVFPSVRTKSRPMSENTLNAALRRLGYGQDEVTPHGFRSMASTILNEQTWNRDAIERQLAHMERNGVRGAYNYAEYLPERKRMMQAWSDYLDGLKSGAKVTPIGNSKAV